MGSIYRFQEYGNEQLASFRGDSVGKFEGISQDVVEEVARRG